MKASCNPSTRPGGLSGGVFILSLRVKKRRMDAIKARLKIGNTSVDLIVPK
jgi:hypothetical protein